MTYSTQLAAAFTPIAAVYDDASVVRALSWAQSFVQGYCDQTFDLVTGDVVTIDPVSYRSAMLPQYPVVNVSKVEGLLPPAAGSSSTGFAWTTLSNYRWSSDTGLIYDTTGEPGVSWAGASWPWVKRGLRVTYDHGYATVPQGLVDVSCRVAQQYLENPTLQMVRRVGDTESRFSGSSGVVVNILDRAILDRYVDLGVG